jgi:hypothetical protein
MLEAWHDEKLCKDSRICSSIDQGGGKRRLFIALRAAPARLGAVADA